MNNHITGDDYLKLMFQGKPNKINSIKKKLNWSFAPLVKLDFLVSRQYRNDFP